MKVIICTDCRSYGSPNRKKPGSDGFAIAAWCVFPIGLPYTLWRNICKKPVCKACDSSELVDAESPSGRRLMALIIGEEVDGEIGRSTEAIQFDLFAEPTVQNKKIDVLPGEIYVAPPKQEPAAPEPISINPPAEPSTPHVPRAQSHIDPDEW